MNISTPEIVIVVGLFVCGTYWAIRVTIEIMRSYWAQRRLRRAARTQEDL